MLPMPLISVRGRLVTVESGPDVTTHPCGSNEEAWALAAKIEADAERDRTARLALLAAYEADGIDVVIPEEMAAGSIEPPSDSEPAGEALDALKSFMAEAEAGIIPAPSDSEPEDDGAGSIDAASDSGPEIGSAGGGPLPAGPPVTVEVVRYEPSSSRLMLNIHAREAVTLYRSAGDRSATFELPASPEPVARWFKADPGVAWEIRMGDEAGAVVAEGVIPGE